MTAAVRRALPLLLASLLLASTLLVSGWGLARPSSATPALRTVAVEQLGPQLHEYTLDSVALGRETRVRVWLPRGYDDDPARRWPMALLLHGRSEHEATWSDNVDLAAFDGMVFVMPDGGRVGWYTDWVDDSGFDPQRWETHHVRELLPWAERELRLAPGRSQRFVAGVSMGGYGAMHYATRYPDRFGGAAELSGFVDLLFAESSGVVGVDGQSYQTYQVPPGAIFGPRETNEVHWRGHNPVDLAANLRWTDLVLRHGNGVPGRFGGSPDAGEAAIRLTGVSLHDELDRLGIEHLWDDYGDGVHTWPYWAWGLEVTFPRWRAIADAADPDPVPFSYRSIEPRWSVYGFEVALERPAREFSRLEDAGPDGFLLTGSGTATVTTAPWYEPGAPYAVTQYDLAGPEEALVHADADGRLQVEVDLGEAHTADQYTPAAVAAELLAVDGYFTSVLTEIAPAGPPPGGGDGSTDGGGDAPSDLPATGAGAALAGLAVLVATTRLGRRGATA